MASLLDEATASVRRRRRRRRRQFLEDHTAVRLGALGARWLWRHRKGVQHATEIKCAECGAMVPLADTEKHIEAHAKKAQRRTRRPEPPRRPAQAPTVPKIPEPPRAVPSPQQPPAVPPVVPIHSSGGSSLGTKETALLTRAATAIGEMDPETAWDLDRQFAGLSRSMLALAENLNQYIEHLNTIKIDARVTALASDSTSDLAEVTAAFIRARQKFRHLYAAQLEAAETNVSEIQRPGFFDPRNAAA